MIFDEHGERVVAVIDWELSTLGHPFTDVAYQCAQWRLPRGVLRGLQGVDRPAIGLPTEQQYLERYCERRKVTVPAEHAWRFYLAVSLFRLAAICQGVWQRSLAGNASSPIALQVGESAPTVMATAAEIIASSP